ncbi:MAG TPA: thiamine phosphate synthase [Cyclobacteriaceae bacterium]
MKTISKLHYITQEVQNKPHWQLAEEACQAGVSWVQLRIKNKSLEEITDITIKTQEVCKHYGSKLIINDHVTIAKQCKTDGVHLGKTDMDALEAKNILGDDTIIGGTANTLEDLKTLVSKGVDYIGLGPFKFTTTKEKLSPILGLEGYREIMKQFMLEKKTKPVIAIGGILPEDVDLLLETGVYGVAVASSIGLASDMSVVVNEFTEFLNR